jgi:hypothetical protein
VRVTLGGKDHLLGPYGSAASREAYRRLIAEWLEQHARKPAAESEPLTVSELNLAYGKFAQGYYGFDGKRGDAYCLRDALRVVRSPYARSPASLFGPLALKACRTKMIEMDWSRGYVNA